MSDVVIEVEVKSDEATKDLNKINKAFDGIEKQAKKSGKASDLSLKSIAKFAIPATASVALLGKAFVSVIDSARAIEDLETQFIAFTGSAEGAVDGAERFESPWRQRVERPQWRARRSRALRGSSDARLLREVIIDVSQSDLDGTSRRAARRTAAAVHPPQVRS